jgi:hypothetical protein
VLRCKADSEGSAQSFSRKWLISSHLRRGTLLKKVESSFHSIIDGRTRFVTNRRNRFKELTVLVSEDRLSVNPKRHSVILPGQSSYAVF